MNLVVPISLYETHGSLWHMLRNYKDGRTQRQREWLTPRVAASLGRFLDEHGSCVERAVSGWDAVTVVPSSGKRAGVHPLLAALRRLPPPLADKVTELLRPGPIAVNHNAADDRGFAAVDDVGGRQILLVDDTFTSGARLQSAASALQLAGGAVVAAVVIGRVIDTGWSQESERLWNHAKQQAFSFATCCLESPTGEQPSLGFDLS